MLSQVDIDNLISEVSGPDTIEVAKLIIEGKENVSEFKLAETMNLGINQVRNMLYRLQDKNLISSTRKKDKKKGWYVYYYTFNHSQASSLHESRKEKKISYIIKQIERSNGSIYTCSKRCFKIDFESALDHDFKCPRCDKFLKEIDSSREVKALKKQLSMLQAPERGEA